MAQGIPRRAVLILLEEGITITQIAREVGLTKQAVSHHLTGKSRELNRDLLAWLEANLDPNTSRAVMREVWAARDAREQEAAR